MPIAIDPGRIRSYVLKCDRDLPHDAQTVFQLRTLTAREAANLEDSVATLDKNGSVHVAAGSQVLKVLEHGLVGWTNFKDQSGGNIAFKSSVRKVSGVTQIVPDPSNFDYLQAPWRRELAEAIMETSTVTEADRVNLD